MDARLQDDQVRTTGWRLRLSASGCLAEARAMRDTTRLSKVPETLAPLLWARARHLLGSLPPPAPTALNDAMVRFRRTRTRASMLAGRWALLQMAGACQKGSTDGGFR